MSIRAPEFPPHLQWFNTRAPLRLAEQQGKMVLLDFWTYCCINCLHILPDLAYLEQKYPDRLTVIGIHSPKFPHERVGQHVQQAIQRYHIHHPVANDPSFILWQHYQIRAWPSIVLINPEGHLVGTLSGEGQRAQLDHLIAEHLQQAERKGLLKPRITPCEIIPEPELPLKFPGKLTATADHLYISDSGHHRILETNWQGQVSRIFGTGQAGFQDGDHPQFNNPQGLIQVDHQLYIADTNNHAIRSLDLTSGQVQTIAGTGHQGANPRLTSLNSPWDLAYQAGMLYIAMAGQHQIWSLNLLTQTIGVYAGSGREDILDGTPSFAAFAQPSGLSLGNGLLYVADSETSAVRRINLRTGITHTLVGQGLFEFGDIDGQGSSARLQHPLGLAWDEQRQGLWLADTYNNKIKFINKDLQVNSHNLTTPLDEPSGLSLFQNLLWIANTNAHQIISYHLEQPECKLVEITF